MKLKSIITSVALVTLSTLSALGGTVTLTSVGGSQFANQGGAILPAGVAIRVGTFNLPPATRDATLAATSDYAQLVAWFKPLGESITNAGTVKQANGVGSQLRTNGFPAAGNVFGTISNVSASYMAPGTQLYVWVFDTANPYDSSQWGIFTAGSWVVPPALGAQALSTAIEVTAVQGSEAEGQLRLITPALTFGNWRMKNFPANASAGTIGFNADPDGDGIHNIAEYAWQLNPNSREAMRTTLTGETGGGTATFTFKTPRNVSDVVVTAECSPDLQSWTPATSTVTASDADFDTRTCTTPSNDGRYFWRVRFSTVTP